MVSLSILGPIRDAPRRSRKQLKRLRRMADARGATLILGSHHQLGETTSASRAEALLNKCAKRSDGDAVKLVVLNQREK